MKKYLVIGNPIEHSLSPKLHNHWIKKNNIDAVYYKKQLNEKFLSVSGGTQSTFGDYTLFTFTSNGTCTVGGEGNIDILVVEILMFLRSTNI